MAIELDGELADRARRNLAAWSNIELVQGDGTTARFDKADVIYVSAGTTRPADTWLDQLAEGGRLVLPLTVAEQRRAGEVTRLYRSTLPDDRCWMRTPNRCLAYR
jgi:protein-L-isoaspartate(D-aspartate) O-methyltransferase